MKATLFIFLFWVSGVCAEGFNDNFETNPLSLQWGASLQEVKKAYPGGVIWPVSNGDIRMHYGLSSESEIYWGGVPVKYTTFSFNADNRLHQVNLQFDYVNHEEINRHSLNVFGFAQKIEEKDGVQKLHWTSPQGVVKMLSINSTESFEWVYFGVQKIPQPDGRKDNPTD